MSIPVRSERRWVRVPVFAAIGVRDDGGAGPANADDQRE